jgi:hypothetical protein
LSSCNSCLNRVIFNILRNFFQLLKQVDDLFGYQEDEDEDGEKGKEIDFINMCNDILSFQNSYH